MIDLVFWSFVVTLLPIALALGARFVGFVAGPLGPSDPQPMVLPGTTWQGPHSGTHRVSRTGGFGHGH